MDNQLNSTLVVSEEISTHLNIHDAKQADELACAIQACPDPTKIQQTLDRIISTMNRAQLREYVDRQTRALEDRTFAMNLVHSYMIKINTIRRPATPFDKLASAIEALSLSEQQLLESDLNVYVGDMNELDRLAFLQRWRHIRQDQQKVEYTVIEGCVETFTIMTRALAIQSLWEFGQCSNAVQMINEIIKSDNWEKACKGTLIEKPSLDICREWITNSPVAVSNGRNVILVVLKSNIKTKTSPQAH